MAKFLGPELEALRSWRLTEICTFQAQDTSLPTDGIDVLFHTMKPMKPMEPMQPMKPMEPMKGFGHDKSDRWWPEELGDSPNSAGGQNEMRYAYFAGKHRLAIDEGGGKVTVYDTEGHDVSGVQQHQSGGSKKIVFTSEKGEMDLGALKQL